MSLKQFILMLNNILTCPEYAIPGLNVDDESSNKMVTILDVIGELPEPVKITPTG